MTNLEKLAEVEAMIEALRRVERDQAQDRTLVILRHIAKDYRGRLAGTVHAAEGALEERVAAVIRRERVNAEAGGAKVALAEELIGRWHVVKQGLELLRENAT